MDFWFPVGDKGLIYSDQGDGDVADLRYVVATNGTTLETPVVVQPQVDRLYALTPDFGAALFTFNTTIESVDGLYMYDKFPFAGTTTAPDAGAGN